MKSTVGRTQSIRYIGDDGDDDAPILKFASLDRGGLDDENDENDEKKKKILLFIIVKKMFTE
jgi:hypothetical protein